MYKFYAQINMFIFMFMDQFQTFLKICLTISPVVYLILLNIQTYKNHFLYGKRFIFILFSLSKWPDYYNIIQIKSFFSPKNNKFCLNDKKSVWLKKFEAKHFYPNETFSLNSTLRLRFILNRRYYGIQTIIEKQRIKKRLWMAYNVSFVLHCFTFVQMYYKQKFKTNSFEKG